MMTESENTQEQLVLIVEDDPADARALMEKLQREGFAVVHARDGEEGLSMAREMKPAIVLLDIVMPKMDGLSMLRALREDDRGKIVPVLLLTNLDDEDKAEEALKAGAFDYLVKTNWKMADLVEKIKSKLTIT